MNERKLLDVGSGKGGNRAVTVIPSLMIQDACDWFLSSQRKTQILFCFLRGWPEIDSGVILSRAFCYGVF